MKKSNIAFIVILIFILTSCSDKEIRPLKFKVRDQVLNCKGIYKDNVLKEIICVYDNGVVLMNKKIGLNDTSSYVNNYENGVAKETGYHLGNHPIGAWTEYFENGNIESYKFYEIINDTSFIIYEKIYNSEGNLISSMLPIDLEINSDLFFVDSTYALKVKLAYSEYDTLTSIVFFDKNENIKYERDSLLSNAKEVNVNFTPKSKGELTISGLYAELGKGITKELNIADRNFSRKIVVK